MATTYGYGGEFSSDEDIDRMEQQSERLQSKFDAIIPQKPTRNQIEETIESIRKSPVDLQDVFISSVPDDMIAGLLDYYKTQRGPIVDSTRSLYKKIILRLIREGQPQATTNGDSAAKDSNGNNNNVINLPEATVASSDEDEPMPSASQSSVDALKQKKKFDISVIQDGGDHLEPMEVDSEEPSNQQRLTIRNKKQVDTSSEDSETEESVTEDSSVDDIEDQANLKPLKSSTPAQAVVKTKLTPKERSAKKPVVKGREQTAEEAASNKKKPYTRSQRQAASKSSKEEKKIDSSSKEAPATRIVSKSSLTSKFRVKYLISALVVAFIAFLLYFFRSDLNKLTVGRMFKKAINF